MGRPKSIPVLRYAWIMDKIEEGFTYRKLALHYYAAFGEKVHYATLQRLMHYLETHPFYKDRAMAINNKRNKNKNEHQHPE